MIYGIISGCERPSQLLRGEGEAEGPSRRGRTWNSDENASSAPLARARAIRRLVHAPLAPVAWSWEARGAVSGSTYTRLQGRLLRVAIVSDDGAALRFRHVEVGEDKMAESATSSMADVSAR